MRVLVWDKHFGECIFGIKTHKSIAVTTPLRDHFWFVGCLLVPDGLLITASERFASSLGIHNPNPLESQSSLELILADNAMTHHLMIRPPASATRVHRPHSPQSLRWFWILASDITTQTNRLGGLPQLQHLTCFGNIYIHTLPGHRMCITITT